MPITPERFAEAVGEIQDSITDLCKAATPKAREWNRWVQDSDRDTWAEMFRSDDDKDAEGKPRVHAVTVAFAGFLLPELGNQSLQSIGPTAIYAVDYWREYSSGNDDEPSELIIRTDVVLAALKLWKVSDLNLGQWVLGHQQLQVPPDIDTVPLGTSEEGGTILVHHAPGTISVLMQSQLIS